jgi:hypothetical protein
MPITVRNSGCIKTTIAASLFLAMVQPGLAADQKFKPINVKTPDGLTISAQEWGNPAGPEILSSMVSHRAIFPGYARLTATLPRSSGS